MACLLANPTPQHKHSPKPAIEKSAPNLIASEITLLTRKTTLTVIKLPFNTPIHRPNYLTQIVFWGLILTAIGMLGCRTETKPTPPETKPAQELGLMAEKAMVVSARQEASDIGAAIMQQGGNAVDAMVATHFALAIAFPYAGNIGGGGFMLYRAKDGKTYALDFREKAPLKAHRNLFLNSEGEVVPKMSTETIFASGVPGSVDGMVTAHARFGQLPWNTLLQPAIDLARKGVAVTAHQAHYLNKFAEEFLARNPDSSFYKVGGWKQCDTLFQPEMAITLERIRDHGRAGFYEGETAALLLKQMATENGLITQQDLDQYASKWREPIHGTYQGYTIHSMPPPSSGGIALVQLLEMTEGYDFAQLGFHTTPTVHLMVEAEKRVYSDRSAYLGDPDFYTVPTDSLLDPAYLRRRMHGVSPEGKATPSTQIQPGLEPPHESEQTTHYSIVDAEGNAVSVTTTLNTEYGSRIVVQGAGFLLNSEMDDFSAKPGVANHFGLLGGDANAIEPGKRMLSSMTPTIVEKDGKWFMVLGTPGGATIITSVYQNILNVINHGMTMQQSVNQGRFHHQWMPDILKYEANALPDSILQALARRGHATEEREPIGRVDAILRHPDGRLEGAADHRRDDAAAGW